LAAALPSLRLKIPKLSEMVFFTRSPLFGQLLPRHRRPTPHIRVRQPMG
jgi:hypothetical protein